MSEMTTNTLSDDTLIRDSQASGFSAWKQRLSFGCCRVFKRRTHYDLTSVPKDIEQLEDKPSYVNRAFREEKQARQNKLAQISQTLPKTASQIPSKQTGVSRTPVKAKADASKTEETSSGMT